MNTSSLLQAHRGYCLNSIEAPANLLSNTRGPVLPFRSERKRLNGSAFR